MQRFHPATYDGQVLKINKFTQVSDSEWTLKLPVYKHRKKVLIETIFVINSDIKTGYIYVINNNTGMCYAPYYDDTYSKGDKVLKKVRGKIKEELDYLKKIGLIKE